MSVLEHIPDRGDSAAIRELVRVVKPGGVVVVTAPYDRRYRETFVRGPVYERQPVGSEGGVENLEIWGEGRVPVENLLLRLGPLRLPLSGFECLLAAISLRQIAPGNAGRPMAAFFTLRKTP